MAAAKWRQVAHALRARIAMGEFPVGSRLPSIVELQTQYDVPGPNTIRSAQRQLAQEGLLEIQQGIGAFVVSTTPVPSRTALIAQLREARAANQRLMAALDSTLALLEQENQT